MAEIEERRVGDVTIRIDRSRCIGFANCSEMTPEAFSLGEDDLVTFKDPERVERECLLNACERCPVEALAAFDDAGNQLAP